VRILSLCTGYAGLDLAVEAVTGARTVAVSDLDKGASKILAHRFPDVPNLGDLKLIDWSQWVGVEYVTAGYPCQPFSHAGKREGTDDPRHIFPYIAEGIRIVGPRLVVLENVRGHLALGFDTVLGTLADIGYDARWVCVRASDVGAPHRRERLFIVATPRDSYGAGLEGRSAVERADERPTRAHGLGATPNADDLGHERVGGARGRREGPSDHRDAAADTGSQRYGRGEDGRGLGRLDGAHEGGARERERSREVAGDRGGETAADTDRHGLEGVGRFGGIGHHAHGRDGSGEVATDWGQYAPAIARWSAVLGRPAPAPTEPGAKGQPRLSPRFVEYMMGLPAGWVTDVPDLTRNEQLKALGNGVVPQQAAAALTFLLSAREAAA